MAEIQTKLDLAEKQSGTKEQQDKKTVDKMNKLNLEISKLKSTISDQNVRITSLDKALADANKELSAGERNKKQQVQNQGNAEAKLNRALEEVEKYKLALREAKINETGKSDGIRRDLDRLTEENKKLERQRNELLQAFKKQMKLIDVLKRQKMHIESAKLLAFTEDEFVRTLELGDKI